MAGFPFVVQGGRRRRLKVAREKRRRVRVVKRDFGATGRKV